MDNLMGQMEKVMTMKRLIIMGLGALAWTVPAQAVPIQLSAFGQTSGSNTIVATANGANTATTLSANANINISQLFGNVTPIIANFGLTAASIDPAATAFGLVVQHFNGSFCLTSLAGCAGVNYLSGTFQDAAIGALGGPGLVVNVSNPPDTLNLTSGVIAASNLGAPSTFNLSFSNVNPALAICGSTLCSFGASFSGTVSSSTVAVGVPEPASGAVLGASLLGLMFLFRRKPNGALAL
jgi:hypothetical protein